MSVSLFCKKKDLDLIELLYVEFKAIFLGSAWQILNENILIIFA